MGLSAEPIDHEALFEMRFYDGGVLRVFPDGRVTGWTGPEYVLINRYPILLAAELQRLSENKSEQVSGRSTETSDA